MIEALRHPYSSAWCERSGCRRHVRVGFRSTSGAAWPYTGMPGREYRVCVEHAAWALERVAAMEAASEESAARG